MWQQRAKSQLKLLFNIIADEMQNQHHTNFAVMLWTLLKNRSIKPQYQIQMFSTQNQNFLFICYFLGYHGEMFNFFTTGFNTLARQARIFYNTQATINKLDGQRLLELVKPSLLSNCRCCS